MGNDPFKLAFIPLDTPSSALSMYVPRVLVGLEMVDCRAMRSAVCSAIVGVNISHSGKFVLHGTERTEAQNR